MWLVLLLIILSHDGTESRKRLLLEKHKLDFFELSYSTFKLHTTQLNSSNEIYLHICKSHHHRLHRHHCSSLHATYLTSLTSHLTSHTLTWNPFNSLKLIFPRVKPHPPPPNKHTRIKTYTMPEGRQSPPPETQSGAQKDAPSDAKGVSQGGNNQEDSKSDLDNFSSNPKGPLDDHAKETRSKAQN
ncbi:hypothetical protein EYC80_005838 [Monilinia laxa]|uniref:Uncharacterized protein n=1 Tax=Monilinia laxa TaxID=61186 RepID=A0A5N6KF91_MONLA|nr:hypothetical protein EYC80_005838 [Monilinia laxa]